jgi:hypothetical protein
VAEVLEQEIVPALDGPAQHHARVAASLVAIVERELRLRDAAADREREALAPFVAGDHAHDHAHDHDHDQPGDHRADDLVDHLVDHDDDRADVEHHRAADHDRADHDRAAEHEHDDHDDDRAAIRRDDDHDHDCAAGRHDDDHDDHDHDDHDDHHDDHHDCADLGRFVRAAGIVATGGHGGSRHGCTPPARSPPQPGARPASGSTGSVASG